VFWGFAVIGVDDYTFGVGGDMRTPFAAYAESMHDEPGAVGELSAS
jgi:hypothetical protein